MKKCFTSHIMELAITGGIVITCAIIVVVAIVINRTGRKQTKTVAEETIQQETETITLKAVETSMEAVTEEESTDAQEEVAPEDMNDEQITEMLSSGNVELINIENIEVVEDKSSEPDRGDEFVDTSDDSASQPSDEVYENGNLVIGIDVSHWQGEIDWASVAGDGITFVMIKCGGGDAGIYKDGKFEENIQGALANGIQVGVYFYSGARDVETAFKEASFCVDIIKGYQITYPVAFDWELGYGSGYDDEDTITKVCETFCDTVASQGYQPMIYSNKNRWYNAFDGEKLSGKYKTWVAQYPGKFYNIDSDYADRWQYGDNLSNFEYRYDMWQYTSKGHVNGINGRVDMDIAFFSYSNYQVSGLQDPSITLPSENKTITVGDGYDFMAGVKGTNSLGYDAEVEYTITNSSGEEVEASSVSGMSGKYTVEYSFKDPRKGEITKKMILTVAEKETQKETEKETESSSENSSGSTEDTSQGNIENTSKDSNTKSGERSMESKENLSKK